MATARITGRILFFSWSVPPATSGSGIIVGNLAKQFGAEEMIVVGERPQGRPPVAWRPEWPAIHYVCSEWPETRRGVRWRRRLQLPWMLGRTLRLARQNGCDKVLAVFPKEEHLLIAYLVAMRTGAALYPYFHNTYVENRSGAALRFGCWLQDRVFARSRHVFVMSRGMEELYRGRYPGLRCSALPHSFNDPLPERAQVPPPGSPLRLVISGSINESCRDAAVRAGAAIASVPDARLTILSGTPRAQLERLGMLGPGVEHGIVSRDALLARLREADIAVLPHGFRGGVSEAEYATIFPTKTIEYLICGRPILAHTPPDCFLTRFLREQDCALVVDQPESAAVVSGIERLRRDEGLRERLVRNALRAAEAFQAPRVAAAFREVLALGA
jgi:glycosyltransferase involved in cell wall biosynthesis